MVMLYTKKEWLKKEQQDKPKKQPAQVEMPLEEKAKVITQKLS